MSETRETAMIPERAFRWTRREFVGALATAAGCLPGCGGHQHGGDGRHVRIGGHPWVYAAKLPGNDVTPALEQIFADMAYAGLDGIELMATALRPDDAVARIRALSEKHGLPVIGASFGGNMWDRAKHAEIIGDARLVVPRLAQLGGRTLGTSVGAAKGQKTVEQLDAQAECVKAIMDICAKNGVVLNLHNHTYEVKDGMRDLLGTLERVQEAKLGPDLNWLLRAGVDPVTFIERFGARIVFLHLRDQKADGRWSEAIGEGDMDYRAIGRALERIHFSGEAVIELAHERDFAPTRPLRESFRISREFVRETLGF
ncbi:MAG TPA: sugar phosphate isomerase/epimerase [Verrucomicrobiae bacterium]|nr:sugar phosphate isomerase/epimerase [Verrucomicrobiae bacterium]